MKFKIPVSWKVYGTIYIEAETLEKALVIAKDEDNIIPLPDSDYEDGSWQVDFKIAEILNKKGD